MSLKEMAEGELVFVWVVSELLRAEQRGESRPTVFNDDVLAEVLPAAEM